MRIHKFLEYWAQRNPDAICVEDEQRQWSLRELDELSNRFARALGQLGIGRGDRVGIVAENCFEWFVLYYGAFKCGVVPVPMNYRLSPREWLQILGDSAAKAIIAQPQYLEALDTVAAELGRLPIRIALGSCQLPWLEFDELLRSSGPGRVDFDDTDGADLYQMYTSGTTGRPKGAVISHAAADANMRQTQAALPLYPGIRSLVVMPLYHAGGAIQSFSVIGVGGTVVLRAAFDAAECVRLLDEESIAIATFVPAMIQAMLVGVPDVRTRKYPKLERIAYGASPIAESTLREAMQVFGGGFIQAFGMTECTSVLTILTEEDHAVALAGNVHLLLSCGRPIVGTDVRIVRTDGTEAPAGQLGEIHARGPQLMKGYWNLPDATSDALAGGWMHTGDVGYLDEAGYLYVSDRLKDMIVSGGENIYPREIEDALFEMAGIVDAAVIGVPDDRWGEAVKAIVVTGADEQLTADDVLAWCRSRLAGFKCPKSVEFVAELPRNPSGKVLKRSLREPYWDRSARNVG